VAGILLAKMRRGGMTKLAIVMLKEGTTDWTNIDKIKLSTVAQAISTAQKRSR
jgi:hypothetical protein